MHRPEPELFNYFTVGELDTPKLEVDEVSRLLTHNFGVDGLLEPLGSQQDQNFLVRDRGAGEPVGVLKLSNPAFSAAEIDLQTVAAHRLAAADPGVRVPQVLQGGHGALSGWWNTSEGSLHARLIGYVSGHTLTGSRYLSPRVIARIGDLAARVGLALAGLSHPAATRTLQWDLQHAGPIVSMLLDGEVDDALRSEIDAAVGAALGVVATVADRLPRQLGHFDVTDDNVLVPPDGDGLPDGVIDFGDVAESWAVGELAAPIASLLHHRDASPVTTLPAIQAFHERRPLNTDELEALWPLVVLRGAVLVLSGRQQARIDPTNDYARAALDREIAIFRAATSVPMAVMTGTIRSALGLPDPSDRPVWSGPPLVQVDGSCLDLRAGTTAPLNDDGAWMSSDTLDIEARRLLDEDAAAVVLPAGAPVLSGAPRRTPAAPGTVPTTARLWLARATALDVPSDGRLVRTAQGFAVVHGAVAVDFALPSTGLGPMDALELPARVGIDVGLRWAGSDPAPARVEAATLPGWLPRFGDPGPALGVRAAADMRPEDVLARREQVLAQVQEHYYVRPPQIERGWREYLVDVDGRVYLDMVNNVTSVGHAHPRIAAAAARQFRLLNTNSRFHYAAIADYAERIAGTLPSSLDTVFLVNSGSEATDLAIRLALASTGRSDVVAMREAYHGWTLGSDAVSTSVADNPNALTTRPRWVHTVDAANGYRGRHRGEDADRYAPEAVAHLEALAAEGVQLAGFISETYFGNAGGVALPDGYLAAVYGAVRRLGGVAIADEVQVGFGRLGEWFWGFEQQGVVPDIVAVAKSLGNGHPIGAVITSRAIAERYRSQGYFFSSTGGSPVSSVIGTTVLDIIEEERLQENARVTGGHLKRRLEELGSRHALIGKVHGSGLYLGLELVRDHQTLEPATAETAAICDRLLARGVIMQPTGDHQNVLKIKPPLCVSRDSVDYFADQLDEVLTTGW